MRTKIANAGLFIAGLTSIAIAVAAMIGGPTAAVAGSPNRFPSVADTPTPPPTPTRVPQVTAAVTPVTPGDPPPPAGYADPYVLKAVNNAQVKPGDLIEFVLVVGNKGTVDAVNVQVRDTLPDHLDIVSVTTSKGTVTIDGRKILVDIGTVGVKEFITIKITAKGNDSMKSGQCGNIAFLNTTSGGDVVGNNASGVNYICGEVVNPPTGGESNTNSLMFTYVLIAAGLTMLGASLFIGQRKAQ